MVQQNNLQKNRQRASSSRNGRDSRRTPTDRWDTKREDEVDKDNDDNDDNDDGEGNGFNRISVWIKRKLSSENKAKEKRNRKNNIWIGSNNSNQPIRKICISSQSPMGTYTHGSSKECRWIQSNQPIVCQQGYNTRWIWFTRDTPNRGDRGGEGCGGGGGGSDDDGNNHMLNVLTDLELCTSRPMNHQSMLYTRCKGSNPYEILIDEPIHRSNSSRTYNDDNTTTNSSSNSSNSNEITVPLFVLYGSSDLHFTKSGQPSGMQMNVLNCGSGNETLESPIQYRVGDSVYVGLPSSTAKGGYRWIGPGEITSINNPNTRTARTAAATNSSFSSSQSSLTYNVYLEAGEKMENVKRNRLKPANLSSQSNQEVENSDGRHGR